MFRARRHGPQPATPLAARPETPTPPPQSPTAPPGQGVLSAARKARHRSRRQILPWLAMPVPPAIIIAAHLAHMAIVAVITAWAVAVLVAGISWKRGQRPASARAAAWKLRWGIAAAVAASWLSWAALAGLGKPERVSYIALWCLPALAWWNRHRTRHRHGQPESEPVREPGRDELLERLRTRVCAQGGAVPGATVTELARIDGGRVFKLALVPGKQTVDTVLGAAKAIASAAEVPLSRVVAEPAPGDLPGERGPENQAIVTILDAHHPQREVQEFTAPTLDRVTGLFQVGPYPDGEMATARLVKIGDNGQPFRAASGITAGTAGSGKSRYAERKIMEHLASGWFQVFMLDGQAGASIPSLVPHVGWPALRPEEWRECLRAVLCLGVARTRLIASRGLGHWDLEFGPFLHVFLEEAHKILADPVNLLAVKYGIQEFEKVGIGFDISTQHPSQVELGANAGAKVLRDIASSGNVTLHRTGGKFAGGVLVGDVSAPSHLLPQIPGMCYVFGASMRTAPVRGIRAADPASWSHLFRPMPFTELDIEALDAGGAAYTGREERITAHLRDPETEGLDMGSVLGEVALMLGDAEQGALQPGGGTAKVTCSSFVLGVLREHGSLKRADIIAAAKTAGHTWTPRAIDDALSALERQNAARKAAGHGVWEVAMTPTRA